MYTSQHRPVSRSQQPLESQLGLLRLCAANLCISWNSWACSPGYWYAWVLLHSFAHELSAEETDANHECPAWDRSEEPQHISQRHQELELSKLSVDWMHEAFVLLLLEDLPLGMQGNDLLGSDGGEVEMRDAKG